MTQARAEWKTTCPACATEIVGHFHDESASRHDCPWCGTPCPPPELAGSSELRQSILEAASKVEQRSDRAATA